MSTQELMEYLRDLGVRFWREGDQIRINAPKGVLTPELRDEISKHKDDILNSLPETVVSMKNNPPPILPVSREGDFPLSFSQQRLWFIDQLEPGNPAYNISLNLKIDFSVDLAILEKCLQEIIRRHESLRTSFTSVNGRPLQRISPVEPFKISVLDLCDYQKPDQDFEIQKVTDKETKHSFDLTQSPLIRATLLRLAEDESELLIVMHHIASDGWSAGIFVEELFVLYEAFASGSASPLPELPIQYADYAYWQRQWMQGEVLESELAFWKKQIGSIPPVLELPTDHPRPAVQTYLGDVRTFRIQSSLFTSLKSLGQREGSTLFMVLLAVFELLIHRYTDQDDIVIGTPIAGRNRLEIENLIGFFVNTLVLRTDLSGNPSFRELLKKVRKVSLDAFAHQDLPFEALVEALHMEREMDRSPIFQVMFVYEKLNASSTSIDNKTAKFDLTLFMYEEPDGIEGKIEFNTDLFDEDTIERMIGHYKTLLKGIVDNPDQAIDALPLLTAQEEQQLLRDWTDTVTLYPRDTTIDALFEAQVRSTPQATAVFFEGDTLTYSELDQRANQLAHHLIQQGVLPGEIIGITLERSLELIIAVLAILKSGGAYLPLDHKYPQERTKLMLEDAQCRLILSSRNLEIPLSNDVHILNLDDENEVKAIREQSKHSPQRTPQISPTQLAYVMFTSGSTGRPKGVMTPHRAVIRLVKNTNYIDLGSDQRFLQFAPVSFDASTLEIWGPLLNGGQLFIYPPGQTSLVKLADYLRKWKITTLWLTAGLFHQMVEYDVEALSAIPQVLSGGDVVSAQHVHRLLEAGGDCKFINGYGPTENTTFTTCFPITEADEIREQLPIGRPINNTTVYILDPNLQPVPMGVPGELFTGGDGLAIGYLNRPELTKEKFIPSPFSEDEQDRLYRTGDLVRYLPDGNIDFLGRIDHQVKIRGFRVELGEIEFVLGQHDAVKENVVVAKSNGSGSKQIVAYVILQDELEATTSVLRRYLREKLPDYMIPSAFVTLDALPLTANGKIDRKSLPDPSGLRPELESTYVAPKTELEKTLARIWADELKIDRVGRHDDFFTLGGHSLLGIRLFSRIEEELGERLPISILFRAPTIAQLAAVLEQTVASDESGLLIPIQSDGSKPPFFCVHGFGGSVLGYIDLAEQLGSDQPVYGLEASGFDGTAEQDKSIEEMASRNINTMRTLQPSGPYRIGGYCMGGVVAYEMARQLEAQGQEVALVAIMEGFPPIQQNKDLPLIHPRRLTAIWKSIPFWIQDYGQLSMERLRKKIRAKFDGSNNRDLLGEEENEIADIIDADLDQLPAYRRQMMITHMQALMQYNGGSYGGEVALFRVKHKTINGTVFGTFSTDYGWGQLARGGVDVRYVDGAHRNINLMPYAPSLASELADCLDEANLSFE